MESDRVSAGLLTTTSSKDLEVTISASSSHSFNVDNVNSGRQSPQARRIYNPGNHGIAILGMGAVCLSGLLYV